MSSLFLKSPSFLGKMWTCTCGTVCPASDPSCMRTIIRPKNCSNTIWTRVSFEWISWQIKPFHDICPYFDSLAHNKYEKWFLRAPELSKSKTVCPRRIPSFLPPSGRWARDQLPLRRWGQGNVLQPVLDKPKHVWSCQGYHNLEQPSQQKQEMKDLSYWLFCSKQGKRQCAITVTQSTHLMQRVISSIHKGYDLHSKCHLCQNLYISKLSQTDSNLVKILLSHCTHTLQPSWYTTRGKSTPVNDTRCTFDHKKHFSDWWAIMYESFGKNS